MIAMTIVFQVLALVVIAVAAIFLFRGRGARHQALRRILLLAFIAAAASSVFFPQIWTWLAHFFGVGRGTDLLLYFLVLIFIGSLANTYRRFRQIERELTALARQLALLNVTPPGPTPDADGSPKK
jgi:hypothetical protein